MVMPAFVYVMKVWVFRSFGAFRSFRADATQREKMMGNEKSSLGDYGKQE
jgi:hypothetical protein